jgi:hypothetical protein
MFTRSIPMSGAKAKSPTPQQKYEKEWLEHEMKGFQPQESEAWKFLAERYGEKISKDELLSLGQVAAMELGLALVRDYKRRKATMIKWFQDNFTRLRPFLETSLEVIETSDPRLQGRGGAQPGDA